MFESLCIKKTANRGEPLDVGLLVESLIFYQKAQVVADESTFKFLISKCGPDYLLELVDRDVLSLSYLENMPGALKSEKPGREPRYDFALIASPTHTLEQKLPIFVREVVTNPHDAERITRRLFARVHVMTHHKSIPDLARADAVNSDLVQDILDALIRYKAPAYQIPSPLIFRFEQTDELFSIATNLDFAAINQHIKQSDPQGAEQVVTPESLLVYLADVNSELHFAAKFGSDLIAPPDNTIVADRKLGQIFSSGTARIENVRMFQDVIFDEGRAIREAVNSGERTLKESLRLIDASSRFKKWVSGRPSDTDLLREYLHEVSKLEGTDSLPFKGLRWLIFAAAGVATAALNPLVGAGLGAIDTFLVDKLVKGWRPNQFVEGPLRTFLHSKP